MAHNILPLWGSNNELYMITIFHFETFWGEFCRANSLKWVRVGLTTLVSCRSIARSVSECFAQKSCWGKKKGGQTAHTRPFLLFLLDRSRFQTSANKHRKPYVRGGAGASPRPTANTVVVHGALSEWQGHKVNRPSHHDEVWPPSSSLTPW